MGESVEKPFKGVNHGKGVIDFRENWFKQTAEK